MYIITIYARFYLQVKKNYINSSILIAALTQKLSHVGVPLVPSKVVLCDHHVAPSPYGVSGPIEAAARGGLTFSRCNMKSAKKLATYTKHRIIVWGKQVHESGSGSMAGPQFKGGPDKMVDVALRPGPDGASSTKLLEAETGGSCGGRGSESRARL